MAQSIQHDQATLILELSAASTPNIHSPIASPGSQLRDAIVSIPLVQNIRQVTATIAAGPAGSFHSYPPPFKVELFNTDFSKSLGSSYEIFSAESPSARE